MEGNPALAIAYMMGAIAGSVLAIWGGFLLTRWLYRRARVGFAGTTVRVGGGAVSVSHPKGSRVLWAAAAAVGLLVIGSYVMSVIAETIEGGGERASGAAPLALSDARGHTLVPDPSLEQRMEEAYETNPDTASYVLDTSVRVARRDGRTVGVVVATEWRSGATSDPRMVEGVMGGLRGGGEATRGTLRGVPVSMGAGRYIGGTRYAVVWTREDVLMMVLGTGKPEAKRLATALIGA